MFQLQLVLFKKTLWAVICRGSRICQQSSFYECFLIHFIWSEPPRLTQQTFQTWGFCLNCVGKKGEFEESHLPSEWLLWGCSTSSMGSCWTCWRTNPVSQSSCSWEGAGTHSHVPVPCGKVHLQVKKIGVVNTCSLQAAACPLVFHSSSCCRLPSSKPWSSILEMMARKKQNLPLFLYYLPVLSSSYLLYSCLAG